MNQKIKPKIKLDYELSNGTVLRNALPFPLQLDNGVVLKTNDAITEILKVFSFNDIVFETKELVFIIPAHGTEKKTQEYIDNMYRKYGVIFIVSNDVAQTYDRTIAPIWLSTIGGIALSNKFLTNTPSENWVR